MEDTRILAFPIGGDRQVELRYPDGISMDDYLFVIDMMKVVASRVAVENDKPDLVLTVQPGTQHEA